MPSEARRSPSTERLFSAGCSLAEPSRRWREAWRACETASAVCLAPALGSPASVGTGPEASPAVGLMSLSVTEVSPAEMRTWFLH